MRKRWFIRLPFHLALTVVVGVWVASYFGELRAEVKIGNSRWVTVAVEGLGNEHKVWSILGRSSWPPLYFGRGITARDLPFRPLTFGFYASPWNGFPYDIEVVFPLWLPTLLLAVMNWIVWRKTRPKMAGRAFPVEPAPKSGELKS